MRSRPLRELVDADLSRTIIRVDGVECRIAAREGDMLYLRGVLLQAPKVLVERNATSPDVTLKARVAQGETAYERRVHIDELARRVGAHVLELEETA